MTTFNDVARVNKAFGNRKGRKPKLDTRFVKQIENIPGEYDELQKAIAEGNIDEVRDALGDIIVFAFGAFHFLGANGDKDLKAITDSLFSRLCQDQADLDATVAKYTALGLKVYTEGKFPRACVKAAEDFVDAAGNDYRKGKFLKSVSYHKPVFAPILTAEDKKKLTANVDKLVAETTTA